LILLLLLLLLLSLLFEEFLLRQINEQPPSVHLDTVEKGCRLVSAQNNENQGERLKASKGQSFIEVLGGPMRPCVSNAA
jgi:hypothetical protein